MTKDELHRELIEMSVDIINDYSHVLTMGITLTFPGNRKVKQSDVIALIESLRKEYNDGMYGRLK